MDKIKEIMKKVLLLMMLMVAMTASAQGTWSTVDVPADELKGEKGGTHYNYSVEGVGAIDITDWKKDRIVITTYDGIFEYSKNEVVNKVTGMNKVVYVSKVLIGLYNSEGVLQEKIDGESYFDEENPKSLLIVGRTFSQTRQIKRMLKAVQSESGYLRVVCKRKGMSDFDIKATPYSQK